MEMGDTFSSRCPWLEQGDGLDSQQAVICSLQGLSIPGHGFTAPSDILTGMRHLNG